MDQIEPVVVRQSWKSVLRQSVWQRLLVFTILFPLGLVAYAFAWAGSISAMVNLSGEVGNRTVFFFASLITLVLVRPASFISGFLSEVLARFTHAQYVNGYLIHVVIDAIYVFLVASIVVVLFWKLFSKIPKRAAMVLVILLWVVLSFSVFSFYHKGYLKDFIGDNPSPVSFDIEEPGNSWDDIIKQKETAFAMYPKETVDDVLLKDPVAGFVSLSQDVTNNVYSLSSDFGKYYEKTVPYKDKMGAGLHIRTYSSTIDAQESLNSALNGFSVDTIDGNKIWRLKANWVSGSGSYIKWISGRRVIDMSYSYPHGYDGVAEGEQFVKAYLKKYPSGDGRSLTADSITFEDKLDGVTMELPLGSQVYKSIDSQNNFVTAAKYDNDFSITTNPQMVTCCEGPVLHKYLTTPAAIDPYIQALSWYDEIKSKKLISNKENKIYYIEVNSTIASPYKVILAGTNNGNAPIQVIELNMPDNALENLFNLYLKTYSKR